MSEPQKIPLTDSLLNSIDFRNRVVGIDGDGMPITEPIKASMTDWFIRDAILPGFSVRVTGKARPGEGKGIRFYAQRKLAGKPCRYPCGEWPETTLKKARETAVKALGLMANGQDPNQTKKEALAKVFADRTKAKLTFGRVVAHDAVKRAEHDADKTKRDRADVANWMGNLKIWNTPIGEVTFELLDEMLNAVRKQRGDASAVKCWRYARAAWNRLPSTDVPSVDPFAEWQKAGGTLPEIKRRQTVIDTDDRSGKDWLQAIATLREMQGSRAYPTRVMADYILLALSWGARRSEAAALKVDDIDFEREFVVFRDTKNKKDHFFPLTTGCAAILRERIVDNNSPRGRDVRKAAKGEDHFVPEWIFPSKIRGHHLVEPRSALEIAQKSSGLKITMHDLRRAFAGEVAADVVGTNGRGDFGLVKLALNHADIANDVTQGYIMVKAKLKMLRPIYEAHERRVLAAAGLSRLLPSQDERDDLDGLIEKIKAKVSDPEALQKIMAALSA
jgi:integrase